MGWREVVGWGGCGVGVEMKNDLSWVKRTYFIFNIIFKNKWIPGRFVNSRYH